MAPSKVSHEIMYRACCSELSRTDDACTRPSLTSCLTAIPAKKKKKKAPETTLELRLPLLHTAQNCRLGNLPLLLVVCNRCTVLLDLV